MCREFSLVGCPSGRVPTCCLALFVAAAATLSTATGAWAKSPTAPAKKPAAGAAKADAKTADAKAGDGKGTIIKPGEEVKPAFVATVNNENISRDELAKECLKRFGTDVLDAVLHKEMIADYCRRHNVVVTEKDVNAEIDHAAAKFKLPREEWLKLLEKERGIKRNQYANDIVWPSLALRQLAKTELTVSKEELDRAYESQFGAAVKVRLIVVADAKKAKDVHAQALANPGGFPALARQHSEDPASASAGGLIQPIRRHLGDQHLEDVAFGLKEDQVSPIVIVRDQHVIMKCEGQLAAAPVPRAQADPLLEDAIREGKLHAAAQNVFKRLEKEAVVQTIFGDPEKMKQMPGVAAIVNDKQITIRELAEACVERNGSGVLERVIDRKLLEQTLRKRNLQVTQADLDAELARAALAMGQKKPNGEADIETYLKLLSSQQKISAEVYMADLVWPSTALKKLVGNEKIKITDDDIKKGYEANYGPRARCRAIVLNNQRKAQEVWEKARDKPTVDHFAQLAKQYSIESNSGSLGGEVPPIPKHGGQPVLEREAFALKPGELSGVIQQGENFVILFCEGFTKPTQIDIKEAKKYIYDDLHEKMQRIAMEKEFTRVQDMSQIDNFLAGTVKSPKTQSPAAGKSATELLANPLPPDPPKRR